jgi:glycosyltransferase involved in cell wall biosynthesis
MTTSARDPNGEGPATATEPEPRQIIGRFLPPAEGNGVARAEETVPPRAAEERPTEPSPAPSAAPGRPLAVFCCEPPDSYIGGHVARIAASLAARQVPVHLFSRHPFDLPARNVVEHAVGMSLDGDSVDQASDFALRAADAFSEQFPTGSAPVAVIGYEWSAVPALELLGERVGNTVLSLHSLERQRSDVTSELARKIATVEQTGLRLARRLLVHDPATAEVARLWVPECGERVVPARGLFPIEQFETQLDPGAIKGRYQVGPVDPTVLYVGDLDERYGPDLALKALPGVLRNNKQVRLIIVGDGHLFWPLRVYTRYLLLEHAVRLVGHIADRPLFDLVQAADVVIVPSRESTPWWPILAAWAARRPVVATHNAAPALLEHERDSVLAYPSENSLVWGIERVLYDPEMGLAVSKGGRQKLEERFGWSALAAQVEELAGLSSAVPATP